MTKLATPTLRELDRGLDELRERVSDDAQRSYAARPNSYSAGYDSGYRDALIFVLESIRGYCPQIPGRFSGPLHERAQ